MFLFDGLINQGVHRLQLSLGVHDQGLPVLGGHGRRVLWWCLFFNLVEVLFHQEVFHRARVAQFLIKLKVEGGFPRQLLGLKRGREVKEVLLVATENCILPVSVTKLDFLLGEVDGHVQGANHGSSNQHRSFARQDEALDQSMLSIQVDWHFGYPRTDLLVVTPEVKNSMATLQLELVSVIAQLPEVVDIADQGT